MSEQERIRALVDEGKISQEEGALLLEALQDIEPEEVRPEEVRQGAERSESREVVEKSTLPETTAPLEAEATASIPPPNITKAPLEPPSNFNATNEEVTRWVTISLLAGDLEVRVDPSLSEPVVEGNAELTRRGEDFEISLGKEEERGFLGNILNWVKVGDLRVRIPAGYGLEIKSQAGDVDVWGVPYLKGKLLAGDIKAQELGGVDLTLQAGDVDVSLSLSAGEHRLKAMAGDVNVAILAGSSVSVEGKVKVGSLSLEGPFTQKNWTAGGRFEGSVGAGEARLEIDLMAGDVAVKA